MTALLLAGVVAASPLDGARAAFQSGDLEQARAELEQLLYPLRLESEALERDAHLLLAATLFALDQLSRAEAEVVLGLGVFGRASFDPLVYPPDFLAFVDQVRARQARRIDGLAAERARRRTPVPEPPRAAPPALAWSFVPLGVGQFKNGEAGKGTALAVAQGVCALVAVGSLVGALSLRGEDALYSHADAPVARTLNVTYLVGAYSFLGVYGYGVIDALVRRNPTQK